jgi:hypothetical protein
MWAFERARAIAQEKEILDDRLVRVAYRIIQESNCMILTPTRGERLWTLTVSYTCTPDLLFYWKSIDDAQTSVHIENMGMLHCRIPNQISSLSQITGIRMLGKVWENTNTSGSPIAAVDKSLFRSYRFLPSKLFVVKISLGEESVAREVDLTKLRSLLTQEGA